MTGSVTQIGGPDVDRLVKKMTEESVRSTVTGYAEMKPINPISATGEYSGGPAARPAGPQEPEPDAEERPEKDEVAEVAEVDDLGAGPADQRELEEQHQEARQHEANGGPARRLPSRMLWPCVRATLSHAPERVWHIAAMTFEAMWRDLLPLGRDPRSGGYHRSPFASAERECVAWYLEQAAARGLEVSVDGQGNAIAWWRPEEVVGKGLLIGSHLDSVVDGGAYDGPLGVVSSFAAIDRLRSEGFAPRRPVGVGDVRRGGGVAVRHRLPGLPAGHRPADPGARPRAA